MHACRHSHKLILVRIIYVSCDIMALHADSHHYIFLITGILLSSILQSFTFVLVILHNLV